jgi:hypothetical protein
VPIQKGFAANPLTDDDVKEKFLSLAEPVMGPERAQRVVDLVYCLKPSMTPGHCAAMRLSLYMSVSPSAR